MMTEEDRLKACEDIAIRMAQAGMGWNYDAIERLTRPDFPIHRADLYLPEPTPYERGVLDRYQDHRHTWKARRR